MEEDRIRLYGMMDVDNCSLMRRTVKIDGLSKQEYFLVTVNRCFRTVYKNEIPIEIADEDWERLRSLGTHTFVNKSKTPLLYEIRRQAIEHLRNTNSFSPKN